MKTQELVKKFEKIIKELNIDIRDDDKWPLVFGQLLSKIPLDEQYKEWEQLLRHFLDKEKEIGHCHKGNIYWQLGVIDLIKGNINEAINYLEESSVEDRIKLRGIKQITASIGLLSITKPLLHRYKSSNQKWELDKNIKSLYETLSAGEKQKFADILLEAHNNFSNGRIKVVNNDFFTFITDGKTREITKDTYQEVSSAIILGAQKTYYSQIFSIGSIAEAFLDELYQRNNQEVWKIFINNKAIQQRTKKDSRINRSNADYPSDMTLNGKVWMLREMVSENVCPITKESVLLLLIISEYRDLIHPRRRLTFEFDANQYVASVLLSSLAYIAGDWWPENIKKSIEANYHLNEY